MDGRHYIMTILIVWPSLTVRALICDGVVVLDWLVHNGYVL